MVMEANRLADRVRGTDLVITGEGRLDRQSMMGKVIAGVAETAKAAGVPVIALVGCMGEGAEEAVNNLDGCHQITPPGMPIGEALARTAERLEFVTSQIILKMKRD
jgi:glycerate kinase